MKIGARAKRHSQFTLLRERRFLPFFGVQFLGAFNDIVFKQALVILLAYDIGRFTALPSDVLQNVAQALERGELVGIFPEGRLTSDGEIGPFRSGTRRILKRSPVPVIPIALSGLWQSVFARSKDKFRHAGRLFPRIRISVGEAHAAFRPPRTICGPQ
jgi:1-acyl-sn-glycerol-3-phosphate acyltransferase